MAGLHVTTTIGADTTIDDAAIEAFKASLRGEYNRETQAFGLASTGGVVSTTGIADLTLGGGLGWLMGKHGLSCDNLLSADIVTADGQFLTASASEHPDLFWGLRGGGGNFGVVTSFEYRLHPVDSVLAGMVLHPMANAKDVLRFYREYARSAPDELTAFAALMTSPEGAPVVAIIVGYIGPIAEGERLVAPVRKFGPPIADTRCSSF
jgi:FAD/FMN-containing dehydrogenase